MVSPNRKCPHQCHLKGNEKFSEQKKLPVTGIDASSVLSECLARSRLRNWPQYTCAWLSILTFIVCPLPVAVDNVFETVRGFGLDSNKFGGG